MSELESVRLRQLVYYFLRLGTLGFGGPIALAGVYIELGGLPWMQAVFYGVGAAVIAIIARSVQKLTKLTLAKDPVLWAVFAVNAAVTALTESEVVWVFVASGLVVYAIRLRPRVAASFAPWLLTGIHGPAAVSALWSLGLYFAAAGAFVFGSGLAIVPFLHGGVVDQHHWLTEQQFVDAVAVAMITPGPVVITVAFIGFLVAGYAGAGAAGLGVFLPCYLVVVIAAPYFDRIAKNAAIKAFVAGVS